MNKDFKLIDEYHEKSQEEFSRLKVFYTEEGEKMLSINQEQFKKWKEIQKELLEELKKKVSIESIIQYELINHECYYTEEYLESKESVQSYFSELSEEEIEKKIFEVFQNHRKE